MATREQLLAKQARAKGRARARAIKEEAEADNRGEVEEAQIEAQILEPIDIPSDNHEPPVVPDVTWAEPKPVGPSLGSTDFTRLDIARAIHSPPGEKLWEMSRIPAGMVMSSIIMRFQRDVVLCPEIHPIDSLLLRIAEGFRGLDGKLIKDMLKLFEVESDKGVGGPIGQMLR